jgi:hypothetical protein
MIGSHLLEKSVGLSQMEHLAGETLLRELVDHDEADYIQVSPS